MAYYKEKNGEIYVPDTEDFNDNFPGIFSLSQLQVQQLYLKYRMKPPIDAFTIKRPVKYP